MNTKLKALLQAGLLASLLGSATYADDPPPIRIGEINGYSGALAAFTAGYRKGMDLAVEQVNAKGGVLGRKLEVLYRDDNFSAADSVRMANELVLSEHVDLLAGTYLSPSGLAVASYAEQHHVLFVATEPLTNAITWEKGSRYVFRVENPISLMVAGLVAKAGDLACHKWAGTGPVSEAIVDMFKDFRADMAKKDPSFQWVGDNLTPLGQFNAGATIAQFQRLGADCILNAQAGPDLVSFIREMRARGVYDTTKVVSLQTGIPEWLNSLGAEAPVGWIVSGYPYADITEPAHKAFVADYEKEYGQITFGSFIGYLSIQAIAAGIQRAGSTDVEAMIHGFRGAEFPCLVGTCRWRMDHQLNLGVWVGGIAVADGKAKMVDWAYITGDQGLPTEAEGLARRPPAANK